MGQMDTKLSDDTGADYYLCVPYVIQTASGNVPSGVWGEHPKLSCNLSPKNILIPQ